MKRYVHAVSWTVVPLIVGMVVAASMSGYPVYLWNVYVLGEPILELNSPLDLGKREYGELVTARFAVANRGRRDLVLDQFRTNCACHSLEYEVNGRAYHLTQLKLAPNEHSELILRFSIRNPVGSHVLNVIHCHTNDPRMPEATFEAIIPEITGGIFTSPTTVLFGTVPIGAKRQQVIDVRDNAVQHRQIKKVLSSNPELFSVRFLPPSPSKDRLSSEGGMALGLIEVTLNAHQIGPFTGEVAVYLDDDRHLPDSIFVSGRVAPFVELSPQSIQLPRSSDNGPLYSTRLVCRSTTGEPLSVTVEKPPRDIIATVAPRPSHDTSSQVITVMWKPDPTETPKTAVDRSLQLRARLGKQEFLLDVPIHLDPGLNSRSKGSDLRLKGSSAP